MRKNHVQENADKRAKYRVQSQDRSWMEERAIRARQWRANRGRPISGLTVHSIRLDASTFDPDLE